MATNGRWYTAKYSYNIYWYSAKLFKILTIDTPTAGPWGNALKQNVILSKFSSLPALEVVIVTTSSASSDEHFINITVISISV